MGKYMYLFLTLRPDLMCFLVKNMRCMLPSEKANSRYL